MELGLRRPAALGVSLLSGALIVYATRRDPVLSPDSISYLSTAAHLRAGRGFTEFTGQPLTVFGPVFPMVLAAGGRSLVWARLVCVVGVAAATWLMYVVLTRRVRPWVAVAAAAMFGVSQGFVRVGATVWSETPYIVVVLTALTVLTRRPLTNRRAAVGGVLCGLGFLTRYAGIGLVITGAAVVVMTTVALDRRQRLRLLAIYLGASATTCAVWVVRNLIETGEALGPRFSGGSAESVQELFHRAATSTGELVLGYHSTADQQLWAGAIILALLTFAAVAAAATLASGARGAVDVAMIVFALTSVLIPVVARRMTASDIDFRVMSPLLIPIIYTLAVAFDRLPYRQVALVVGVATASWWAFEGAVMAGDTPDIVAVGAGSRTMFSTELYELIEALPADANVLTNSPQRVWWQTHREPTLFAFVRPRAGNSNYPLSPSDTLKYACRPDTYLAWFVQGDGPAVRRPDLIKIIDVTLVQSVSRGEMYRLTPHDPSQCPG
ncbi:unannotated protein [freshwater metagenome]|uniref:Unannotated protein n=1 Tax=freshwater metagenome TaxID=449393 RepID=A0A6J7EYL6_9ZZZZ|nr:hypothetical protein [Actinomycetota bacterium]